MFFFPQALPYLVSKLREIVTPLPHPPVRDDATGSLSNGDFFGGLSFALPRRLPRVPCAYRLAVSRGFRAPSSSRFPAVFDLQPRSERRLSTIETRHRNSTSTLHLPRTPRGAAAFAASGQRLPRVPCAYRLAVSRGFRAPSEITTKIIILRTLLTKL